MFQNALKFMRIDGILNPWFWKSLYTLFNVGSSNSLLSTYSWIISSILLRFVSKGFQNTEEMDSSWIDLSITRSEFLSFIFKTKATLRTDPCTLNKICSSDKFPWIGMTHTFEIIINSSLSCILNSWQDYKSTFTWTIPYKSI